MVDTKLYPTGRLSALKKQPKSVDEMMSYYAGRVSVGVEYLNNFTSNEVDTSEHLENSIRCYPLDDRSLKKIRQRFPLSNDLFETFMLGATSYKPESLVLFDISLKTPFVLSQTPFVSQSERDEWQPTVGVFNHLRAIFLCRQNDPDVEGIANLLPPTNVDFLYTLSCDALQDSLDKVVQREETYVTRHIVPFLPMCGDSPNVVFGQIAVDTRQRCVAVTLERLIVRSAVTWLFSEEPYVKRVAT